MISTENEKKLLQELDNQINSVVMVSGIYEKKTFTIEEVESIQLKTLQQIRSNILLKSQKDA